MNDLELFEHIEDYLKNRLSPEAKRAFEEAIARDPDLAENVALHRELINATAENDIAALRKLMEDAYTRNAEAIDRSTGMHVSYRRIYQWAAAASVLLILGVGVWWMTRQQPAPQVAEVGRTNEKPDSIIVDGEKTGDQIAETSPTVPPDTEPAKETSRRRYIAMANDFYQPPEFSNIRGAADSDSLPPLERAKRAFSRYDYRQVVKILRQPDPSVEQEATYLRGHAFFKINNYAAAARDFRAVLQQESMEADNASWYLMLSILADKGARDPGFQEQLKAITDDTEHPFNSKAKELAATLNQ